MFDGRPETCVSYGAERKVTSKDFTIEAFVKLDRRPRYDAIAGDWNEDAITLLQDGILLKIAYL